MRRVCAEGQATGCCVRQPNVAVDVKGKVCGTFVADDGCCVPLVVSLGEALEGEAVGGRGLIIEEGRRRGGGCRAGGGAGAGG